MITLIVVYQSHAQAMITSRMKSTRITPISLLSPKKLMLVSSLLIMCVTGYLNQLQEQAMITRRMKSTRITPISLLSPKKLMPISPFADYRLIREFVCLTPSLYALSQLCACASAHSSVTLSRGNNQSQEQAMTTSRMNSTRITPILPIPFPPQPI
jgi:hypothetical protein